MIVIVGGGWCDDKAVGTYELTIRPRLCYPPTCYIQVTSKYGVFFFSVFDF